MQINANIGAVQVNNRIGQTGVHLRFHTGSEYARLYGAQRAEIHNWRHYSIGKLSATGYPEGDGCGCYVRRSGQGGRSLGCGGRGRVRGLDRDNFEIQVSAIIAKTAKNEANKLTNALESVAASDRAVNGYFLGIPPPFTTTAPKIVVSAADVRKQQATEYLNHIAGRG